MSRLHFADINQAKKINNGKDNVSKGKFTDRWFYIGLPLNIGKEPVYMRRARAGLSLAGLTYLIRDPIPHCLRLTLLLNIIMFTLEAG